MTSPLRAITVCVDYSDLLAITLPYNQKNFQEILVVTSTEDYRTRTLCTRFGVECFVTNKFYDNGASFNKWLALETALDHYGRYGWLCIMDADVLWPQDLKWFTPAQPNICQGVVNGCALLPGILYSPLRHMIGLDKLTCGACDGDGSLSHQWAKEECLKLGGKRMPLSGGRRGFYYTNAQGQELGFKTIGGPCEQCDGRGLILPPESTWKDYPIHRNTAEWAGYSQIFHCSDPVLGSPPWHQTDWKHAGGADSFFQAKWKPENKMCLPFNVLHLGEAGRNWFGRSAPLVDGTVLEGSQQRYQAYLDLWPQRRLLQRHGKDPFGPEKVVR